MVFGQVKMLDKNTVPHGYAIPDHSQYSVTCLQPKWTDATAFGNNPTAVAKTWKNSYPRLKVHQDINQLGRAALKIIGLESQSCFLFCSLQSALESVEYATSSARNDVTGKTPASPDQISVRAFRAKSSFYAVIFPQEIFALIWMTWKTPGVGVSVRFADTNLKYLNKLIEVALEDCASPDPDFAITTTSHETVRQRIVYHLSQSPLHVSQKQPASDDVYLYPSGMAAIYKPHRYLCNLRPGTTVLFGMAFLNTISLFEEWGQASKFFGLGTDDELSALEAFLVEERSHGRHVQAIWAEYPTNPRLTTPDLVRLRALADEFDTVLVIDSTISGFANVDILHMTDFLVASLTKSFNGYADLLAGGVILNPGSKSYTELKPLFDKNYVPEVYIEDIEVLEKNSRDYIPRTIKLNNNAAALVDFLHTCAQNPQSCVSRVNYPTVNSSRKHFDKFMRPKTTEFNPGYGCLFSIEFETEACASVFYDNINLWKTPHLGAPWTLLFAYTVSSYNSKLEWAAKYDLVPSLIRVSAGLEDTDTLIEEFKSALQGADHVWRDLQSQAGR